MSEYIDILYLVVSLTILFIVYHVLMRTKSNISHVIVDDGKNVYNMQPKVCAAYVSIIKDDIYEAIKRFDTQKCGLIKGYIEHAYNDLESYINASGSIDLLHVKQHIANVHRMYNERKIDDNMLRVFIDIEIVMVLLRTLPCYKHKLSIASLRKLLDTLRQNVCKDVTPYNSYVIEGFTPQPGTSDVMQMQMTGIMLHTHNKDNVMQMQASGNMMHMSTDAMPELTFMPNAQSIASKGVHTILSNTVTDQKVTPEYAAPTYAYTKNVGEYTHEFGIGDVTPNVVRMQLPPPKKVYDIEELRNARVTLRAKTMDVNARYALDDSYPELG